LSEGKTERGKLKLRKKGMHRVWLKRERRKGVTGGGEGNILSKIIRGVNNSKKDSIQLGELREQSNQGDWGFISSAKKTGALEKRSGRLNSHRSMEGVAVAL